MAIILPFGCSTKTSLKYTFIFTFFLKNPHVNQNTKWTHIFLVKKKHVVNYSTSSQMVGGGGGQSNTVHLCYTNEQWCWNSQLLWGQAASYTLPSVLIHVWSFGSVFYATVCINTNLNTSHSKWLTLCSLQVQSFCLPNTPSLHKIIHYQKSSLPISKSRSLSKMIISY
jgi:hypothetical protein